MHSLFETGAGLITLDKKQIKEGLTGSVAGTVELSVDTVKGAGSATGRGLAKSANKLTGNPLSEPEKMKLQPFIRLLCRMPKQLCRICPGHHRSIESVRCFA